MCTRLSPTVLISLFALSTSTIAQEVAWDQQNLTDLLVFPGTYFMTPAGNPVGQQFTPTFNSLDIIGVVPGENTDPTSRATFQLFVHQGSDIFGPIVAASESIPTGGSIPGRGFIDFKFAQLVDVISGQMYTFEVRNFGPSSYGLRYTPGDDYIGGKAIVFGNSVNADLVFRQGLSIPEPGVVSLCSVAAGALWIISQARRRLGRIPINPGSSAASS